MSDEADRPMSARRQLRLAVVARLQSLRIANVFSPGAWPTDPVNLPALLVSAPMETKQGIDKNVPKFNTSVSVVVQGQLQADTNEAAQDAIECLAYDVENALLTGHWLVEVVQGFSSVQTDMAVEDKGGQILAGFRMTLNLEVFEAFDPMVSPPVMSQWPPAEPKTTTLQSIGLHADMTNVFDATGTYPNPPFPDSVNPAPRISGPDGRDEGALDITLPQ